MSIEISSDHVLLVELPGEPQIRKELNNVIDRVQHNGDCDVVLDFSNVTILVSWTLVPLIRLKGLLDSSERRLLFCCMTSTTRDIFSTTALDDVFDIVKSRSDALALTQASAQQT